MTTDVDSLVKNVCAQDSAYAQSYQGYAADLQTWQSAGLLSKADIAQRRVLDWECGGGVFSVLFSQMGAARVVGIDSWLDIDRIPPALRDLDNVHFERIPLEALAEQQDQAAGFDLVFANTVTEHLPHL